MSVAEDIERIEHTKHGALGHRVIITYHDEFLFALDPETIKAHAALDARIYCAKEDSFPRDQLASQAMRGKPDRDGVVRRWSVWVRVIKRPATHPWNEERRLRESEAQS